MAAAVGDVGHFYGLPSQCGVNSSGAKEPGWQSAIDDVTTTYLSIATGVDMLTGVGMVSGGRIFSYQEMALAVETTVTARTIAAGVPIGGAALSVERLAAAAATTTAAGAPGAAAAAETAFARATERVRAIAATHQAPPLPASVDAELRRLAGITD
jgi:trimethylamine:corrinoid methyltransferase-like protein